MDLEARYENSKCQPYKRPPGQKVTDFQLMVEGLEGRQRREPETSEKPNSPSRTSAGDRSNTPARWY